MEDFPQLIITFLTTGFHTVAGALNISAAVFGFLAKVAEAYATDGEDLPTGFAGVNRRHHAPSRRGKVWTIVVGLVLCSLPSDGKLQY